MSVANASAANSALDTMREQERNQKVQRRKSATIKQQLQQDRESHTFTVEWYDRDLPFNPLPKEASDELEGKRARMSHCAQNGNWEELAEQADSIADNAADWLAEAWDGDEPMFAEDWTDIYDSTELLELLNKVDQRGEGAEIEAVAQFLGN